LRIFNASGYKNGIPSGLVKAIFNLLGLIMKEFVPESLYAAG
jgi:hypothetical protein